MQMGDIALLAVSDRDPGGDELIWTGATASSTAITRGGRTQQLVESGHRVVT